MPREVPCNLSALIDSWSQRVSEQADHSVQSPQLSPRTLRPRPIPRPQPFGNRTRPLAPISGNPRKHKLQENKEGESLGDTGRKSAKRARKMPPKNTGKEGGDPLKMDAVPVRGRPLGSKNKSHPAMSPPAILNLSPTKSSSKNKPGSPKRAKSRANAKIDTSIDIEYLESCSPSVSLMSVDEAVTMGQIPQGTWSLYQKLNDVSSDCIPAELKVRLVGIVYLTY